MNAATASVASPDAPVSEQDFGDVIEPVVAAFDYQNKKLGLAFYSREQATLFIAHDIQHEAPPHFDAMKRARFQIEPDLLLLSSRAEDAFSAANGGDGATAVSLDTDTTRTQVRPGPEFSSSWALSRLADLQLEHCPDLSGAVSRPGIAFGAGASGGESERRLAGIKLCGSIDESAKLSLGCANAVLCYIEKRSAAASEDVEESLAAIVQAVSMYTFQDQLAINPDTLYALGIFGNESHPNVHADGAKESLTLFGVLNTCRTTQGKLLLRSWFAQPSLDHSLLNARYDAIECLLMPSNTHLTVSIATALRKCADMRKTLAQLKQGRFHHGLSNSSQVAIEWQRILQFSFHLCKIRSALHDLSNVSAAVLLDQMVSQCRVGDLNDVGSLINDVIDFDSSQVEQRVVVQRGIDDPLDRLKDTYDSLDGVLDGERQALQAQIPRLFSNGVQCIYLPQIGFLTVMPALNAPTTSGRATPSTVRTLRTDAPIVPTWQDDRWTFTFSTAEHVYFKTDRMVELDEYYGDVHTLVVDREIELLYQLSLRVLRHADLLTTLSDAIATLDCLLAFAEAAKKRNYCRPTIVEESVLDITGGRHPLQEIVLSTFVENDTCLRGGNDHPDTVSAVLLTGANYSGKSVYLKQVGLIVYMAHIGCYVPATSATIGLTDKILTRINTRETVSKPSSAFLLDLQQVALITTSMTARSLILVDEFGKGTDSLDGAALFGSLVEFLTGADAPAESARPRALIATHFHEMIESGLMQRPPNLKLQHLQIMIPNASGDAIQDDDRLQTAPKLTYLYRLADGPSLGSFGLNCAMMGGIPPDVLARAAQLLTVTSKGESLVHALAELTDREKAELRRAEGIARAFLKWDLAAEKDTGEVKTKLRAILGK